MLFFMFPYFLPGPFSLSADLDMLSVQAEFVESHRTAVFAV